VSEISCETRVPVLPDFGEGTSVWLLAQRTGFPDWKGCCLLL